VCTVLCRVASGIRVCSVQAEGREAVSKLYTFLKCA